jgi:hypothetical protein
MGSWEVRRIRRWEGGRIGGREDRKLGGGEDWKMGGRIGHFRSGIQKSVFRSQNERAGKKV